MKTKYFTVNGCGKEIDALFPTFRAAVAAWEAAGKPTQRGSDVWVTEHSGSETVRTITIN